MVKNCLPCEIFVRFCTCTFYLHVIKPFKFEDFFSRSVRLPPLVFSPPSFRSLPFIYSEEGFPSEDAMGEKEGASWAVGERKGREPPLRTDGGGRREAASSASGQLLIAPRGKEDHERVSLQRTGAGQTRRRGGEGGESFLHFLFHLLFFALFLRCP